ncbi:glycosyltransferase family 39 protein [Actinoplanes sp. NPDC048988]|uniref:glycosyltransferase family 39 protein n=1 Tax=Actinoplanes sp. NPDC048988 TaxID=3363901 RepID=UPI003711A6E9
MTGDTSTPVRSRRAPSPASGRWLSVTAWVAPLLAAVTFGVWHLTTPALWADELATWGAVRVSWSQLWQLSGTVDAVLAPYYAVMKVYTAVAGTSTAALRLPGLLAFVLTAVVITAIGRRVAGPLAGSVAALLFVVTPTTSRYAQEARPYAIVMLLAAIAVLCLIRLVERPSAGRLATYAAVTGLAGALHPLSGLFLLAAHAVAVVWLQCAKKTDGWPTTLRWLAAAVVGALPALLLAWWASGQTAQVSWIGLVGLSGLQAFPSSLFGSAAVGGLLLVLALVGLRPEPALVSIAATALIPTTLMLSAGAVIPIWVPRYALFSLPAIALLAATAAVRFGRTQAFLAIGLAVLLSWPSYVSLRLVDGHGQDSENIAAVIGPRYRPGDVVVFPDTHPSIPWAARDIYERYLPAPRPPDVLARTPQRRDGKFLATECPNAACLGNPPRIWVVRMDSPTDPLQDMNPGKRQRINQSYRTVQRFPTKLLVVVLLERKTPTPTR